MQVMVYEKANCPVCEKVVAHCKADEKIDLEIKNIDVLANGDEFNPTATKFLAKQNFRAPLVFVDGNWCEKPIEFFNIK